MRVKRGIVRHRRHKKIRALAKGYRGMRRSTFVKANEAVIRAGTNAYVSRKLKKRSFRALWITRISAALKMKGIRYSVFIDQLTKKKVGLDRKTLSELAIHHPEVFGKVVEMVGAK
ncbi:MAG: 50S ribosomal protein L20 [Candidatus Peribacteraceae bacterium]|nr:50S ribosomal protein L20 [Candidatus Peribacteraceae bacterium]